MSSENTINSYHLDIIENLEDAPVHFGLTDELDEGMELVIVSDDLLEPLEINHSEENRIDFEGIENLLEKQNKLAVSKFLKFSSWYFFFFF